ncbi:sugar phosphate isomerase/epimerase family protein [Pseudomonas marginalis]|uniref:sugar phosphate isomerase/epimerase family protein n=1 Tax=Pseudomonas TaxID=286 RepID=UPI000811FC2D|nr:MULTISPECIES: TIM barrel protein [Pseudomonas]MDT9634466.1 TIM barrel protein [Pseudomonas sp. JV449]TKJ78658.1 xylose isomerase [Pseudomonas sp. CFBP13509]CRM77693.1 Xylose isomerase-like TIM barrel [Pseudomonas sp. 8 R 14]SAM31360.1 Xylose isomerase-like TIM barrel [Pseudomonas sp. 1 R 17]
MKLEVFRTLWGYTASKAQALEELLEAGFDGMEARLPMTASERAEFAAFLRANHVSYISTVFSAYDVLPQQSASVDEHLLDLDKKLAWAAELSPRFINLLAGNDRWPLAQQVDFFGRAMDVARKHGQVCAFETHRARSLFNPWVTLELIRQLPDLRFTSDISHWVVTCERLLNDPEDDLSAFVERVHHIQARVGYDQGPQVPHPAAPEYTQALAFHQQHWEAIWRSQESRGYQVSTLTPEFGADGYLHHLPFTNVPVADLWSLNVWMANTEREHFRRFSGASTR